MTEFAEYCLEATARHERRLANVVAQVGLRGGQILPSEMMVFAAVCLDQGVETVIESGRSLGYSTEFLCRTADWRVISYEKAPKQEDVKLHRWHQLILKTGDGARFVPEVVRAHPRPAVLLDGPKNRDGMMAWASIRSWVCVGGVHDVCRLKSDRSPNPGRRQAEDLGAVFTDDDHVIARFGHHDQRYFARNGSSHTTWLKYTCVLGLLKGDLFT